MTDYNVEYNNRERVPEHEELIAAWVSEAEAYRARQECQLDLAYGQSDRSRLDLFLPEGGADDAPLALFIHGGYWQTMDGKSFSHMARGLNGRGVRVAVATYDLCPEVRVADIIGQIRDCCLWLWRREHLPITVFGHSAGGHLAAAMLATDWKALDSGAAMRIVPAAYAISGVFDLTPLVDTYLNDNLQLDEKEARAASPAFWDAPAGTTLVAAVGGDESSEFLRQSHSFCDTWQKKGVDARYREFDGSNHFTVISNLVDAESAMVREIHELIMTRAGSGI